MRSQRLAVPVAPGGVLGFEELDSSHCRRPNPREIPPSVVVPRISLSHNACRTKEMEWDSKYGGGLGDAGCDRGWGLMWMVDAGRGEVEVAVDVDGDVQLICHR